jgi:hypothetical protein
MVVEWILSLTLPVIPGFTVSNPACDVTDSELPGSGDAPTRTAIASPGAGR